jgi:hypothetical protein
MRFRHCRCIGVDAHTPAFGPPISGVSDGLWDHRPGPDNLYSNYASHPNRRLSMDASDLLVEQYRTVRQESLDALGQMQTINQWGLGSIGVSTGLGLVASQHSVTAAAVVLMGLVPVLITFGMAEMAVLAQRVVDARRYLRRLEMRLADQVTGPFHDFVGWECERSKQFRVGTSGFPFAVAMLGIAFGIGPGLGGALLAAGGRHWVAFVVGEILDIVGLAFFTVWITCTLLRIKGLNERTLSTP